MAQEPSAQDVRLANFDVLNIRARIWELELGTPIAEIPDRYRDPHCGTNGGPPSIRLANWSEYGLCPTDPDTGLHEVWFTEDDEAEYIARSYRQQNADPGPVSANVLFNHKVVYSVLIDDSGLVQGYRAVTDTRESNDVRMSADVVGIPLRNLYRMSPSDCINLPPEEGESPVEGVLTKELCEATKDDKHITIYRSYLRKPGQVAYDPLTGRMTEGYFESQTRLEVIAASLVPAG